MQFFSLLCVWLLESLLITASPTLTELDERTVLTCNNPVIKIVTTIFKQFPAPANKICSDILKRGPNPTTTKTVSTTVQTTVTSGTTIVTQSSGLATATTTTTITVPTGTTATTTVTTVVTLPVTTTVDTTTTTQTVTVTTSTTGATSTYVEVYDPPRAVATNKKRSEDTLGRKYAGCPKALSYVVLSVAATACNCCLPPVSTSTVTTTSTSTNTVTVLLTLTTIVPSSTTTVTVTSTIFSTIDSTITTTATSTSTSYIPVTATSTTTATTTTTIVALTTSVVTTTYENVPLPRNDCVYNEYYDYRETTADATNNYQAGVDECAGRCSSDPQCKFFFFLKFDPAKARGYGGANCILDNQPYNSAFLQCGYVDNYNTAYNKGTQVTV